MEPLLETIVKQLTDSGIVARGTLMHQAKTPEATAAGYLSIFGDFHVARKRGENR